MCPGGRIDGIDARPQEALNIQSQKDMSHIQSLTRGGHPDDPNYGKEPVVTKEKVPDPSYSSDHISKIVPESETTEDSPPLLKDDRRPERKRRLNVDKWIKPFARGTPKKGGEGGKKRFARCTPKKGEDGRKKRSEVEHSVCWRGCAGIKIPSMSPKKVFQGVRFRFLPCFTGHEKNQASGISAPDGTSDISISSEVEDQYTPINADTPTIRSHMFEIDAIAIGSCDMSSCGPEVVEAWRTFREAYVEGNSPWKIIVPLRRLENLLKDISAPDENIANAKKTIERVVRSADGWTNIQHFIDFQCFGKEFNLSFRELRNAVWDLNAMHPNSKIAGLTDAWTKLDRDVRRHAPYERIEKTMDDLKKVLKKAEIGGYSADQVELAQDRLEYFNTFFSENSGQTFNAQDWLSRKAELDKPMQPVNDLVDSWESIPNIIHTTDLASTAFRALEQILKAPRLPSNSEDVSEACWNLLNAMNDELYSEKEYSWLTFGIKTKKTFKPEQFEPVIKKLKVIANEYMAPDETFHFYWRAIKNRHQMPKSIRKAHQDLKNCLNSESSPSKSEDVANAAQNLKAVIQATIHRYTDKKQLRSKKAFKAEPSIKGIKIDELRSLEKVLEKAFIKPSESSVSEQSKFIPYGNAMIELPPDIKNKSNGIGFIRAMAFGDLERERNTDKISLLNTDEIKKESQDVLDEKFTRYLELMEIGWNELVSHLKQQHKFRFGLSSATDMAWQELINKLHHGGSPNENIACLKKFANNIEADMVALKQSPPGKSNQLGRYAQEFAALAEKNRKGFDRWLQSISVTTFESFTDALEKIELEKDNIRDKHRLRTGPIGQGGATTFHWLAGPVGLLEANVMSLGVGAAGGVLLKPAEGGYDYLKTVPDGAACGIGTLGFIMYHILTIYSETNSLILHRKLRRAGTDLQYAGRELRDTLNSQGRITPENRKVRDVADLAVALGETMYNGGTQSLQDQIVQIVDILRHMSLITTGVIGLVSAFGGPTVASTPVLLSIAIGLATLGMANSIYYSRQTFLAAMNSAEHQALLMKRLTRLVESMDEGKLKLEPAVEMLIRRAKNEESLAKSFGQSEWLFVAWFVCAIASSALTIAAEDAAAPISKSLVKAGLIISGIGVTDFALYGLWALFFTAKNAGRQVTMSRGVKAARKAHKNYNQRHKNEEAFEKHETYKKRLTKYTIVKGVDSLRDDAKQISKILDEPDSRGSIEGIRSELKKIRHDLKGQKFDPNVGSGFRISEWGLKDLQARADSVKEQTQQLRPIIAQSLVKDVADDLKALPDFESNQPIREQLRELADKLEDEPGVHSQDSDFLSSGTQFLSVQVFAASKTIVDQVIKVLDSDLAPLSDEKPGKDRITLERAKVALKNKDLIGAAEKLNIILKNHRLRSTSERYKHLRHLMNTVTSHMKYSRTLEQVESEMIELSEPGYEDDPDSSGPAKIAANMVSRELLREDPQALPAMLLVMLQSKNPILAKNASDTLRGIGATEESLSRLRGKFSMVAVNYVAQLIGSMPATGSGPVVGVVDSMPSDHLAFDQAWGQQV